MRRARTLPKWSRTARATARPAFCISESTLEPAAKAACSRARISAAVTSFTSCRPSEQAARLHALDEGSAGIRVVDGFADRRHHEGHGHRVAVREADLRLTHADELGARLGLAVQVDQRFAAAVRQHLNLAPADAAHAGAQRLHRRFLGGEAYGNLADASTAVGDLVFREDAPQEALRVASQRLLHPVELDGVDAAGQRLHGPDSSSDRRLALPRGVAFNSTGVYAHGMT